MLFTGLRFGAKRFGVASYNARALIGSPGSGWQDVEMGGVNIANPPGHPNVYGGGATVLSTVLGESGYVAVGSATFWDENFSDPTAVGAIWHSADGLDWRLIDPRDLVGGTKLFQLQAVIDVPGGYIAAGSLADSGKDKVSLQILQSTNGVDWQKLSTIDGTWSLNSGSLYHWGDELLLTGVEYACQDDASHLTTFGWAPELRMWRSSDNGATWQLVDLTTSGLITQPEPMPTQKGDCPSSVTEQAERFRTSGSVVGIFDDTVLVSGGEGLVATTSDLTAWQRYTLPGADAEGSQIFVTQLWSSTQDGLQLTSLETWRDPNTDRAFDSGWQSIVWQIPAAGGEAVRLPSARPMLLDTVNGLRLIDGPGDEIWLTRIAEPSSGNAQGLTVFRRSVAGPIEPWGGCDAAPNADCKFAVLAELNAPGADLSGIDLRAARISGGDLSGANLTGALLADASINAELANAKMTGANLVDAFISSSVSGANLIGANLTGAQFNVSFFDAQRDDSTIAEGISVVIERGESLEGHDFSGQDLQGYRFNGSTDGNNMRDADFSGAKLQNASFSAVDLTGADFSGAALEGINFGFQVTCPDGEPNDTTKLGGAGCRL